MNRASPCINVCVMDTHTPYCTGCWRTLEEIAAWGQMSDAKRQEVWQQLALRQAQRATAQAPQAANKPL